MINTQLELRVVKGTPMLCEFFLRILVWILAQGLPQRDIKTPSWMPVKEGVRKWCDSCFRILALILLPTKALRSRPHAEGDFPKRYGSFFRILV
jgi:hypothetical protein